MHMINKKLVQRMYDRILVESIVESFFRQIYKNHDRGGAKEWIDNRILELTLESNVITCDHEDNTITYNEEIFNYDFQYITNLCISLLKDKIEV